MLIVEILRNRNFVLVSAVVLGLLIGKPVATFVEPFVLPALAVVMTLSTTSITSRDFATLRARIRLVLVALVINYLITGGVILLLGRLLIQDSALWTGLVVIAAVPPGIASVPWSQILGGDILLSLTGIMISYLFALVLTPAIIILFLGVDFFSPFNLLILVGELIIIPFVASRILLITRLAKRIDRWRGPITNWSFFIVLFTIIGLNRAAFFTEYNILVKLAMIALIASFGLSYVVELVAEFFGLEQPSIISLILVGAMKNFGLASGILLTLFSERATIPASIMTMFFLSRTIWLSFHFRRES